MPERSRVRRQDDQGGPSNNEILSVRPTSTFESFEVTDASQQPVIDFLQHLANTIIGNAVKVANPNFSFPRSQVRFISGPVGTGKSHLTEAFINRIVAEAPELQERIFLSRENFTHKFLTGKPSSPFEGCPIVILDDIFQGTESLDDLHLRVELPAFLTFALAAYDARALVLMSSNFPLDGILQRVEDEGLDPTRRARSRLEEMIGNNGEFKIDGPDFRSVLRERMGDQPGGFDPFE